MKLSKSLFILPLTLSAAAYATVDVQSRVTIVSENIQEGGFFTQSAPAEFCIGILPMALAKAITRPILIQDNYGCGEGSKSTKDVNAASCAVVTAEEVVRNGEFVSDEANIKVDTSKCKEAANPSFQQALKKAIIQTFKTSKMKVNFVK